VADGALTAGVRRRFRRIARSTNRTPPYRYHVGPLAAAWLKRHHGLWAICSSANDQIVPQILDGYHVRTVIARELAADGVSAEDVPGTTYAEGTLG
jgi:hypothetical protein